MASAVVAAATCVGTISASAGQEHGGSIHPPKGVGVDLPGQNGGGGIDLPGGGGVHLPGGGNGGGGVDLPGGGGSVDLPGGGGSGGGSTGLPSAPVLPSDDGGGGLAPEPGGAGGDAGGSGNGGRGGGQSAGGGGGHGGSGSEGKPGPRGGREIATDAPPLRNPDGSPTSSNPTLSLADFGAAPIGVPNFMIDQFSIPPFLLPIYQACGTQYGIPWQVLASINRIETAFGTNLNVSTAGAQGWMQFIPSTWEMYGVDANNDGRKDPYNPVDAICAAARYLNAAGGEEDLRTAIFAYNHADWYVDEVLLYARQYGNLPDDLVGSLTGLTEGARFPVAADARYADDISEREAAKRAKPGRGFEGNAADTTTSSPTRRGINIYSRENAPVIAVNDGTIRELGSSKKLGNYIVLEDAYGNRFTYAELGEVAEVHPVAKDQEADQETAAEAVPADDEAPAKPASKAGQGKAGGSKGDAGSPVNTEDLRERVPAFPERQPKISRSQRGPNLEAARADAFAVYERLSDDGMLRFDRKKMRLVPLEEGSKVVAGTVLGRIGQTGELAPHLNFAIRPAGRGAPKIDPKPILDGWKLLEATALYRASGSDPFADASATAGQVLLMSKEQLARRVLKDPRVELYECGRQDIETGQIDRRILAVLSYLSASGFRLGVTSLKCGHSVLASSGNVSNHSTGSAVDIATVNGLPILGNQGPGSITETVLHEILDLQGSMVPDELISLMDLGGPSFALPDHDDHIHVGYSTAGVSTEPGGQLARILTPAQWKRLIGRIAEIENPKVPTKASDAALPAKTQDGKQKRASPAHRGE